MYNFLTFISKCHQTTMSLLCVTRRWTITTGGEKQMKEITTTQQFTFCVVKVNQHGVFHLWLPSGLLWGCMEQTLLWQKCKKEHFCSWFKTNFIFAQDDKTGLIIGLTLFFAILTISFLCLAIVVYHFKMKTKHYYNFVNWYYKPISDFKNVGIIK